MATVGSLPLHIHAEASKIPELALLAAVVRTALLDAQRGDQEAAEWLASPLVLPMLNWITPSNMDINVVQAQLVETSHTPAEV